MDHVLVTDIAHLSARALKRLGISFGLVAEWVKNPQCGSVRAAILKGQHTEEGRGAGLMSTPGGNSVQLPTSLAAIRPTPPSSRVKYCC